MSGAQKLVLGVFKGENWNIIEFELCITDAIEKDAWEEQWFSRETHLSS